MLDHQVLKLDGDKEYVFLPECSSKLGWVFLLFSSRITPDCRAILFNAFTMETIHLPDLKVDDVCNCAFTATFSTIPTCSDCVFYVVLSYFEEGSLTPHKLHMCTYSYGDETWNSVKLSLRPSRTELIRSIICMNNIVYITFCDGEIWAYDIEQEEEDWLQIHIDCSVHNPDDFLDYKLVEYNGEMLLVSFNLSRRYRIFKIDWSSKAWVEQCGLSNLALFFGDMADNAYAVSITSDYGDEKINSLRKNYINIKIDGDGKGFFFILYEKGNVGLETLPECTEYMAWARPH